MTPRSGADPANFTKANEMTQVALDWSAYCERYQGPVRSVWRLWLQTRDRRGKTKVQNMGEGEGQGLGKWKRSSGLRTCTSKCPHHVD